MTAVIQRIRDIGIVPVVKLDDPANAVDLGRALVAGGIPIAEVTFRTDAAADSIRAMTRQVPDLLVGAGTVTTMAQAETALAAGARFIVSPSWDAAVVDGCLAHGIPILPGVCTPEGVANGVSKGLKVLKFFPAEVCGGVAMLDALSGPFGGVSFVPTGGIGPGNIADYARRPQVLAVGGSWMVKDALVQARDWPMVERLCREALIALHGFTFAHVGINGGNEVEARKVCDLFSSLFGLKTKEGLSSIFSSESMEITKAPLAGARGHLGFRCNDVERAMARLALMGVQTVPETLKLKRGKVKSVYLDLEIAGFAIHLLKA